MLSEHVERRALAHLQVTAQLRGAQMVAVAQGAKVKEFVELADPDDAHRTFNEWLTSPLGHDRAKARLLQELGVA